jgi:hypothetical protein
VGVEEDARPLNLKLVWGGGKIVKDCDSIIEANIWRCNHCGNQWSGWNHAKALGHAIGGRDIRGCMKVPLAWKKLYLGIAHHKSKATALKLNHLEMISISLNEKEQDTSEYVQREENAIRTRRYKGSLPTDSVVCPTSPSGDLSNLPSQKSCSHNIGLKPSLMCHSKNGQFL